MTASSPPSPTAKPGPKAVVAEKAERQRDLARGAGTSKAPSETSRDSAAELRLFIGRDGLGIELAGPSRIGCLEVTEISVTVQGIKFPLDVSGGIAKFRHKRGILGKLAIDVRAQDVAAWAAPRLRGVIGPNSPEVWIRPRPDGATIALAERDDVLGDAASGRALAFEVAIDVAGEDVRVTAHAARGVALPLPATALAIAALSAAFGPLAKREGATFVLAKSATRIARALLPDAGVRAPSTEAIVWSSLAADRDTWILHASNGQAAIAGEDALRAREVAQLVRDGDDARVRGDFDAARAFDLVALERAPRHREVARRIAEIDATVTGRAEAALAILTEAQGAATARDGVLLAALYEEAGDIGAAQAAYLRAAASELSPALAARAYARAAELATDDSDALDWLDRAVVRAPRASKIRWSRIARRVAAGRLEDALADVEHLEAQAQGARAKHLVWRRAGTAWRTAGARGDAAALFERALRFVPDEPESLAGLGAALVAEGRASRGVALLVRAIEIAEEGALDTSAMVIELARALAERLDDRPAAIARLRAIGEASSKVAEARGLEGRYRGNLGDLAGASLAFARMRELAAQWADGEHPRDDVVPFLIEAATFERESRGDLLASQRHLAVAIRLAPRNPKALAAYKDVGQAIAKPLPDARPAIGDGDDDVDDVQATPVERSPAAKVDRVESVESVEQVEQVEPIEQDVDTSRARLASALLDDDSEDDAVTAARVEELTRRIQLDPTNDAVADELGELLAKLGRSHELLALLSARLEDAPPERREALRAPTRVVLEKLEADAKAKGRDSEAALYRDAVMMFGL